MATILDLPYEILNRILYYTSAIDVARISATCKKLYDISTENEIWQRLCVRDYGIPSSVSNKLSFRSFYSKVLYRYGILIGMWNTQIKSYGGLLQVKFQDNKLMGIEWHYSSFISAPRKKSLFSIELDEKDSLKIYCLAPSDKKHECKLEKISEDTFFSKCLDHNIHIQFKGKQQKFAEWFFEETQHKFDDIFRTDSDLLALKYFTLIKYNNNYEFKRLYYPKEIPELPHTLIQPGLFKGDYEVHKTELVMVTYPESTMMKAVKITGDAHVPAGEVTFEVDLRYPVILTKEETNDTTMDELLHYSHDLNDEALDNLEPQVFIIPTECRGIKSNIPTIYKSRFYGNGTLASMGFMDSSQSPVHWLIFDNNTFGLIWLEMYLYSMFHRVLEKFD